MSKIRGSKLDAAVDSCRGLCNWTELTEYLPSIQAKNSGMHNAASLIEGELILELFIERQRG